MQSQLISGYFLNDHARVHRSSVYGSNRPSQLDLILDKLAEQEIRQVPEGAANSIAWLLFHTTRCEDSAFNVVLAGEEQVFDKDDWQSRMAIERRDIGTEMTLEEVKALSSTINVQALLEYRDVVGRNTKEFVMGKPLEF